MNVFNLAGNDRRDTQIKMTGYFKPELDVFLNLTKCFVCVNLKGIVRFF